MAASTTITTTSLSTTSRQKTPSNLIAPQWLELRKRARTLDISVQDLNLCNTIEDFKLLIKQKYRAKVKKSHPDQVTGENGNRAKYGNRLNKVIAAYRWLNAITPEKFARVQKNRTSIPDIELPLDWGTGWLEYDSSYAGFTIRPRL